MLDRPWFLHHRKVKLLVDGNLPQEETVSVDCETDESDNIYCISVCGNTQETTVFFDFEKILPELKKKKIIFHGSKADIAWLEKYGFSMNNVYFDTMLMAYVLCSSRSRFGLKAVVKEDLGIEYPSYKELTHDKENIQAACEENRALYIEKIKVYKRKESVTLRQLPKKLRLPDLPRMLVANYSGLDAWATVKLYKHQIFRARPIDRQYHDRIELPTCRVLYDMERKGIRVNLERLVAVHKRYLQEARHYHKDFTLQVHPEKRTIYNIASPVQVGKILKEAGIKVKNTDEDTLLPYKEEPLVKALLGYRGAIKICSTYTKPLYKLASKNPGQRIHGRYVQQTLTGRLSCRNPNIQNQPEELRGCYEAKPGHVFVNADYSQIELRVPAHFSQEPLMLEAFNNPTKKIHQVTADQIGRDYHTGKTVNFLLTNSGGSSRLAQVANVPEIEAQEVLDTFWKKFSTLDKWTKRTKAVACRNGYAESLFGRRVPIEDLRSKNGWKREAASRSAMSVRVQGTASELMKLALIRLHKLGLVGVLTLHDELMFEVPEKDADIVALTVKYEMENVVKLSVPIVAEVGIGRTWAEAKKKD